MSETTLEQKKRIFCVMNGHSNIVTTSFGYVHCARCGDQLGDSLGGAYSSDDAVIVGHKCEICNKNMKKLTKRSVTYISAKDLKAIGYKAKTKKAKTP